MFSPETTDSAIKSTERQPRYQSLPQQFFLPLALQSFSDDAGNETANNGAAENCSGAAARVTAAAPPPPQSLSLSR
jgi:hypothetical protein